MTQLLTEGQVPVAITEATCCGPSISQPLLIFLWLSIPVIYLVLWAVFRKKNKWWIFMVGFVFVFITWWELLRWVLLRFDLV